MLYFASVVLYFASEANHMQDIYFQRLLRNWGRCGRSFAIIQDLKKLIYCI